MLSTCVFLEDIRGVQRLLDTDVNVNALSDGTAPLHVCCSRGLVPIAKLLLAHRLIDVNLPLEREDGKQRSPLLLAVVGGYTEIVEMLLDKGARVDSESLRHAALKGHFGILRLLLDAGADLNQPLRGSNKTLLFLAALRNDARCVRELLRYGADASVKCGGVTVLEMARSKRYVDVVEALRRESRDPGSDLMMAEVVRPPVRKKRTSSPITNLGADIHAKDSEGNTPLHLAAKSGALTALCKLIEAGAHVNAVRKDGATPLLLAIQHNRIKAIPVLVAAGARVPDACISDGAWQAAFVALQRLK